MTSRASRRRSRGRARGRRCRSTRRSSSTCSGSATTARIRGAWRRGAGRPAACGRGAVPLDPQWGTEPNGFYIPPRWSPRGYIRQMFGPGVDNAIDRYIVPSRELLAVLQLWRTTQQIIFRYDVIPGPKVFETQIHGRKFEMYNDTVLAFNKSGKEVVRIQVEEPIYIRPAERVQWL